MKNLYNLRLFGIYVFLVVVLLITIIFPSFSSLSIKSPGLIDAKSFLDEFIRDKKEIPPLPGLSAKFNSVSKSSEPNTEYESNKEILSFNLDVAIMKPVINPVTGMITIMVNYGTDLSALRPVFSVSPGAISSPASGTLINFSSPVSFTVTAQDGTSKTWLASVSEEDESICSMVSPFSCDQLVVPLPISLDFNGSEGGLGNTGFTMTDYPSERLLIDGPVTYPKVPGFEPGRLSFSNGNLVVNAPNGIAFRSNGSTSTTSTEVNSQINALGVGIDVFNSPNFDIFTTIVNPTSGSNNGEQAGLWFGLNEDNYFKLVVGTGNKIQVLREINGISSSKVEDNIVTGIIANLNNSSVRLRFRIDLESNLVKGYYKQNNNEEVFVGSLVLPINFKNGNKAYQNLIFAGIFASKRRQLTQDVNYSFADFSIIKDEQPTFDFEPIRINFSRPIDQIPSGYLRDGGMPFGDRGNGYSYGWLATNGTTPIDITGNTRNRFYSNVGPIENTIVHMQYADANGKNGNIAEAIWRINVPNGNYQVSVGVGDPIVDGGTTSPSHTINVNGVNAVTDFVPTGNQGAPSRLTTAVVPITVFDEKIVIDALGGFNTKIHSVSIFQISQSETPYFTSPTPQNNSINVPLNSSQVNVAVVTPNGFEIDKATISGNVHLYELEGSSEVLVPSNSNDSGGGDAVTLTPIEPLKAKTTYIFRTTSNIKANRTGDLNDRVSFLPFESRFTTGEKNTEILSLRDLTGIEFIKVSGEEALGAGTVNERFSSLVIGPDGKLYGSTIGDFQSDGKIFRWNIELDGTLSNLQILTPDLQGSPHPITGARSNHDRLIIGFAFDPNATAENLIAYITHSQASLTNGPEWDGKITKLSGPNLSTVQDLIIHLPRSTKDHLTNSITFDNEGFMYFAQGSNSAGGQPDPSWGNRPESLLAGATLKVDLNKLPQNLPLSAYTTGDISIINTAPESGFTMSDGTYNPYSTNSPITIFASGVRNAYDLVWHSNGWLYMPINGTAGNNSTAPNTPSTLSYPLARRIDGRTSIPFAPAMQGGESQKDWLAKTKGGTYHGHPNPYRGEFVLNHGGVPYSGIPGQAEVSFRDVAKYPTNLAPDVNFKAPAFDFGKNKSPNGVFEYKSDAFGGRLQGTIMVVRFSGQNDILVLDPKSNGDIGAAYDAIPGLRGFVDPLDIVEDPKTGNIYVSEYDRSNSSFPRLSLLRAAIPASIASKINSNPKELLFEVTRNGDGNTTDSKTIEIINEGNAGLNISGASFGGNFANQFTSVIPSGAATLNPGQKISYTVNYGPTLNNSNLGYQDAKLVIASDNLANPNFEIGLHALKKDGFEGNKEPTLDAIVKTLGIGINVGWSSLTTTTEPILLGDEVLVQQWIQAGPGNVNIKAVGRYSPSELLPFGWYTNNGNVSLNQVGVLTDGLSNSQRLFPTLSSGSNIFDPNGAIFGIYVQSTLFGRVTFTEDELNLTSGGTTPPIAHRARVYPNKDRQGNPIPNSYLVTFEDASNGDYQDYIFIIDNVIPYQEGALKLNFDKESVSIIRAINDNQPISQNLTLNTTGQLNTSDVIFTSSDPKLTVPQSFVFGSPFAVNFNKAGLSPGLYHVILTASANNYPVAEFRLAIRITGVPSYEYQFNFQTPSNITPSPQGYIDDLGVPYGLQASIKGDLNYGWVVKGSNLPANTILNGRNRNNGTNNDALLKTFTTMGHRSTYQYPTRDWLMDLPDGYYYVNLSVGDQSANDSQHFLDVNGVRVVEFDQQFNNVNNLAYFNETKLVEVINGKLRLSLADGGVNAKLNYLRIAPLPKAEQPPQLEAIFSGISFSNDTFRGPVSINLVAKDRSGSSGISRLEYKINGNPFSQYSDQINIQSVGDYSLLVEAVDGLGNISIKEYNFSITEPTGATLSIENMTKIPTTQRAFPSDDYFTFYRLGERGPNNALYHDSNIMRLNNTGTGNLVISEINISDVGKFVYTILPKGSESVNLPLTIQPGSFREISISFIGTTGDTNNALFKENIQIVSNSDSGQKINATLNGGYAPFPEGGKEIDAQMVIDVFGFKTSMLSIVNDQGTITPPNSSPESPSSFFPKIENIDLGYEGDLILSPNFVRADPSKPIYGIQLAALHGLTSNGAKFIQIDGTGTVGSMNFSHDLEWYQSLYPRSGSEINYDVANTNIPFRLSIENYLSSGGNNNVGRRPDLLGLRVYKAIDRNGNPIPNEYIVMQDFIGSGCGAGSANCDWQDNVFYFTNIRPEAIPSVTNISNIITSNIDEGIPFKTNFSGLFNKGYPGNKLIYNAVLANGDQIPNWIKISANGFISGIAPKTANSNYVLTISATDANGLKVQTNAIINVNKAPIAIANSDKNKGRKPFQVSFDGGSSSDDSGIVNYFWQFGDGNTSNEINPSHFYPNIGTYKVVLKVTDIKGLVGYDTLNINVVETDGPMAIANSNLTVGFSPLQVDFNGSNSESNESISIYNWSFGDGQSSNQINPIHTFSSVGTYRVILTVNDVNGLSDKDTLTIQVNAAPLPTKPILLSPANNINGIPEIQILTWSASSNAQNYRIQLAKTPDFSNPIIDVDNLTQTSFTSPILERNTMYFWRVKSNNQFISSDWSSTWNFTTVDITSNLSGHWKMDEGSGNNLLDASGFNNHAILQNPKDISWIPGKVGLAAKFSGGLKRFGIAPHSTSLNITDNLSISAWIRPINSTAIRVVVLKGDPNGYRLGTRSNGKIEFSLYRASDGANIVLESNSSYAGDGNTWTHVAATFDGTKLIIFINGVKDSELVTTPFKILTSNSELFIGANKAEAARWQGDLDDVRVYGRTLTAHEVTALFIGDSGSPVLTPGLPQQQSPSNGAVNQPLNAPLGWVSASNSQSYEVNIAENVDFSLGLRSFTGLTSTNLTIPGLEAGKTYHWRVRGVNGGIIGSWSTVWSFSTITSVVPPPVQQNPVGHWKMDEGSGNTLFDASGFGNHAVLQNSKDINWIQGKIGLAAKFSGGLKRYGVVPHSESLNITDNLSISAWIRPSNSTSIRAVILKGDPDGYRLGTRNNGKIEFSLYRASDGANIVLESNGNYAGDGNTWTHVAATFDGTKLIIFINGVKDSELVTAPFKILTSNSTLFIGANKSEAARWQGDLDDVRVYGRTLTTNEITEIYNLPNSNFRLMENDKSNFSGIIETADVNEIFENEIEEAIEVTLFPNPADQTLNLKFNRKYIGSVNILVVDMLGRTFIDRKIESENSVITIDFNSINMSPGVYSLVIKTKTGQLKVLKFIKK